MPVPHFLTLVCLLIEVNTTTAGLVDMSYQIMGKSGSHILLCHSYPQSRDEIEYVGSWIET